MVKTGWDKGCWRGMLARVHGGVDLDLDVDLVDGLPCFQLYVDR